MQCMARKQKEIGRPNGIPLDFTGPYSSPIRWRVKMGIAFAWQIGQSALAVFKRQRIQMPESANLTNTFLWSPCLYPEGPLASPSMSSVSHSFCSHQGCANSRRNCGSNASHSSIALVIGLSLSAF